MKQLIKIAKVLIPLALAAYLMFETFKDPQRRRDLFEALGRAEYIWVLISMLCAWLSHMIRARRWKYLLEPMGYRTRFWNAYHAVMSGYLINMAIPRLGEVVVEARIVDRPNRVLVPGLASEQDRPDIASGRVPGERDEEVDAGLAAW